MNDIAHEWYLNDDDRVDIIPNYKLIVFCFISEVFEVYSVCLKCL